jgi:hypothetical protein
MVSKQVPWKHGNPAEVSGAQISFSAALSLNILQHLRSEAPQPSVMQNACRWLTGLLTRAPGGSPRHVPDRLQDLLSLMPAAYANSPSKWLEDLNKRPSYQIPGTTRNAWEESDERMHTQGPDLPALIMNLVAEEESFFAGMDLRSFLTSCVADNEKVEVYVTGHSKGGAVSSTLALWLADTQGENIPEEDRWDPKRKATVYAYSFASPTAGNGTFARHSDNVIGPRSYRIVNPRDIAPYAWAAHNLRQIPPLYALPVVKRDLLQRAIETLIRQLDGLDYAQIGKTVRTDPGLPHSDLLFAEIIYQHLDGYFERMGLGREMSAKTFFTPLLLSEHVLN